MSQVVLRSAGSVRSIEVDGVVLGGVRRATVVCEVGSVDRVEVEFVLLGADVMSDAEVVVAPGVAESLQALGWTPPA